MGECYSRDMDGTEGLAKLRPPQEARSSPFAGLAPLLAEESEGEDKAFSQLTPRARRQVRGAAEAYHRMCQVSKRGLVSLDMGTGTLSFPKRLGFRLKSEGLHHPHAELRDPAKFDAALQDVVEVAMLLGGPLVVEGVLVKARVHSSYSQWAQELAEARARLVAENLVERGLSPELVEARGRQKCGDDHESSFDVTVQFKDFFHPERHAATSTSSPAEPSAALEPDPAPAGPDLDASATRIQASVRGRLARRDLRPLGSRAEEERSATRIQAVIRGRLLRKSLQSNAAPVEELVSEWLLAQQAEKIQAMFRGHLARKGLKSRAAPVEELLSEWLLRKSAEKIQALFLGRKARKDADGRRRSRLQEQKLLNASSVKIQSAFRGHIARRIAAQRRRLARMDRGATRIQSCFKGMLARRTLEKRRAADADGKLHFEDVVEAITIASPSQKDASGFPTNIRHIGTSFGAFAHVSPGRHPANGTVPASHVTSAGPPQQEHPSHVSQPPLPWMYVLNQHMPHTPSAVIASSPAIRTTRHTSPPPLRTWQAGSPTGDMAAVHPMAAPAYPMASPRAMTPRTLTSPVLGSRTSVPKRRTSVAV